MLINFLITLNIILTIFVLYLVRREAKRRRILQAFIAGIIRSITDYISRTDFLDLSNPPYHNTKMPISYDRFLAEVKREFEKDFWINPYNKWIQNDRNLFTEEKYGNDGFTFMYFDFHDQAIKERIDLKKANEN